MTSGPHVMVSGATGSVALNSATSYRVTTRDTVGVRFDVTDSVFYPFEPSTYITITTTAGTLARAGTAPIALTAFSRHFDFTMYPVSAKLASTVNPADATHATAPVDVTWELLLFGHTTLATNWALNLTTQAAIAPGLQFSSGITTTASTLTEYTAMSCTPVVESTSLLRLTNCDAVTSPGNAYYAVRVIRFGPVRTTYSDYQMLFTTYGSSAGMLGSNVVGVSVTMQNTDLTDETITNSPPSVVVSHMITTVISATVSNVTEPPEVFAQTNQVYTAKVFFFSTVTTLTISYAYTQSTQIASPPTSFETCTSKVADTLTGCSLAGLRYTQFNVTYRVPYELS